MGTGITFAAADGSEARGYLARPGRARAPGIVVIQEWWGVQDQIRGMCDRLAAAGYDALAPDLYNGVSVPYHDHETAGREMASLDFNRATDQIVRGAAQFLKGSGVKAGLTGFCLGGAVSVLGAARIPELSAAVPFYGLPLGPGGDAKDIKCPVQCHFANTDDWCTPDAVNAFEKAANAAGKSVEIHRYDARHGFMNEQEPEVYDRAAAETAWERMLQFWSKHLG
jgi:carboxymethylenebutenolidase